MANIYVQIIGDSPQGPTVREVRGDSRIFRGVCRRFAGVIEPVLETFYGMRNQRNLRDSAPSINIFSLL